MGLPMKLLSDPFILAHHSFFDFKISVFSVGSVRGKKCSKSEEQEARLSQEEIREKLVGLIAGIDSE